MQNATPIILGVGLFLLSVISGLVAWIFKGTENEIRELRREIARDMEEFRKELRRTNRRLGSTAAGGLVQTMRIVHVQDFLQERLAYHPPSIIGRAETAESWEEMQEE